MKIKTIVLLASLLIFLIIMSSGYGLWHRELIIEGSIEVVPDPKLIEDIQLSIRQKHEEINELREKQILMEDERLLKEQQPIEEEKIPDKEEIVIDNEDKIMDDHPVESNKSDENEKPEIKQEIVDHTDEEPNEDEEINEEPTIEDNRDEDDTDDLMDGYN